MAGDSKKLQPIIVKRIRRGGHGHHTGAWKIAYADFVTAMMAFFLLMWLLGSTTEGDKKGIADYFNSPLRVALMGGSGSGDSSHVIQGGGADLSRMGGQVKAGDIDARKRSINLQAYKAAQRRAELERLQGLKNDFEGRLAASQKLAALRSQIRLDMTSDGLRIQIVDAEQRPMFASGSAIVQPSMRDLLRLVGEVLSEVPNRLTLEGHTDAAPYTDGVLGYGNWELSADRANASRRELVAGGLPDGRVLRVQGLASSVPLDGAAPLDPANRRISIIVMNREAEARFFGTTEADDAQAPPAEDAVEAALPPPLPSISPAAAR
jgi:chemotaxis protein MotB